MQSAPAFSAGGEAPVEQRWWTAFDDPRLNQQIDLALSENFDLVVAWERLRAAEAVVDRASSDHWPNIDATGEIVREQSGELGGGIDGDDHAGSFDEDFEGDDGQTELTLGLAASYEVDLWGRIRSRVEAERLRASASRAGYQIAALTLTAEVARAWYRLAETRSQLRLIDRQVETNQAVLKLLETRFGAGQIRSADVLRQRQLVEATREQAIAVRAERAALAHRLAVLQGRAPQGVRDVRTGGLVELPALPTTGAPADLLRRRPDVRQAHRLLRAADRDLASAISAQYPRLNLMASVETAAESPENLFREWFGSLAGQLVAPVFDAGQRRAEVRRTAAVARQRLAAYGQTALEAFSEVEDALANERHQVERMRSVAAQLALADKTYVRLRKQYLNGVTDYLGVLDALTEQQRLERELLRARLGALEFRIALYRALAGPVVPPTRGASEEGPKETADG